MSVDPDDPRAALLSLTGLTTHLHTSCHAEAAQLREIEAAAREWLTVPRRERYADQLDAAHQRLVDALAEVLDLDAGVADVLDKAGLTEDGGCQHDYCRAVRRDKTKEERQ